MKQIITLLFFVLFFTLNVNSQMKINDFTDAEIYFRGIFDDSCKMDDYGNVLLDMGSASAGRYSFRITDVKISKEEKAEEPGCADVCPPRILIHFTCKKSECIIDPSFKSELYLGGTISFEDLKKGNKAFEFLIALQDFIKNN